MQDTLLDSSRHVCLSAELSHTLLSMQTLQATDFTIEYFPGYKVVTNQQTTPPFVSVLYPCGTEPPAAAGFEARNASGVAFFAIPLTAVATDDSTAGWALVCL